MSEALEEALAERNELWTRLHAQEAELQDGRARIAAIEASRSWRATRPLRRLEPHLERGREDARRRLRALGRRLLG